MSEVVIRHMQASDLLQVVLLDHMSFSLPWSPRAFEYELANPMARRWVAETVVENARVRYHAPMSLAVADVEKQPGERAVIGMLVLWLITGEAHIATLAVHPDFRRGGIGRRIIVTALEDAARRGMRSALLEVRAGSIGAQNLYRGLGFEVVGRRPRYYRDTGEDAILMTLSHLDMCTFERLALEEE